MFVAQAAPRVLHQATSFNLANAVTAILVVLAIFGAVSLFQQGGRVQLAALIVVLGIFEATNTTLQQLGTGFRGWLVGIGKDIGIPELATAPVFTVIVLVVLALVAESMRLYLGKDRAARRPILTLLYWVALFLLTSALFTLSWAQDVVSQISMWAVQLLGWLQRIHT